jgi:hypothetical protein
LSGFGLNVRPDDADELVRQARELRNRSVNAIGEAYWVSRVLSAGNDPLMQLASAMQVLEIYVVVRQNGPLVGDCIREDLGVCNPLPCPPRRVDSHHVMSQAAKFLDHGERVILIGVKPGHER